MAAAFVDLAEMKVYAGVTSTGSDDILQSLLDASTPALEAYCNRKLAFDQFTDYLSGTGKTSITLANYPLADVSSLVVDGQTISRAVGRGDGYYFPPGGRRLFLRGRVFSQGVANVAVTYTAGYDLAPDDLKLAVKTWVQARFKERTRIGEASKTLAGESITFNNWQSGDGMPSAAKAILKNYMNFVPMSGT